MKRWIPKRLRDDFLSMLASVGYALGRSIPRSLGLFIFANVGRLFFLLSRKERRRTLHNLRMVYGQDYDPKWIARTALRVFSEAGKNLFDALSIPAMKEEAFERTITHDSLDEFREAYSRGRGVFVITAHLGCFEMLLHLFARKGFRCFAVGRKFDDPRIESLVRKMRSGPDIAYMDRSESSRKIIRYLQEGRVFGALVDQDTKVEGVFADFLGKTAFTPSGPVRLAMKLDVPAFVVTTVRVGKNRHHVFLSKQLILENTGDFKTDLVKNVQKVNDIISDAIRRHPGQWVWMHRRWRTKPQNEAGS